MKFPELWTERKVLIKSTSPQIIIMISDRIKRKTSEKLLTQLCCNQCMDV